MLLAVNPYKKVEGLYTEGMKRVHAAKQAIGGGDARQKPHPYAL